MEHRLQPKEWKQVVSLTGGIALKPVLVVGVVMLVMFVGSYLSHL